jgi:hypothetical protein
VQGRGQVAALHGVVGLSGGLEAGQLRGGAFHSVMRVCRTHAAVQLAFALHCSVQLDSLALTLPACLPASRLPRCHLCSPL